MSEVLLSQIMQEVAGLKQEVKAAWKRIDEQKALAESVYGLVSEVKVIARSLEHMADFQKQQTKTMEKMDARMDAMEKQLRDTATQIQIRSDDKDKEIENRLVSLENKDGKTWSSIKEKAITAAVSGIVGAVLAGIGFLISQMV